MMRNLILHKEEMQVMRQHVMDLEEKFTKAIDDVPRTVEVRVEKMMVDSGLA